MKKDKNVLDKPNLAYMLEVGGGGGKALFLGELSSLKNWVGSIFTYCWRVFLKNFGWANTYT